MSKMKIVKNSSFLKVSGKMDCRFEFSVIFYVFQHRSKLIFDIFSKMFFFNLKSLKTVWNWIPEGFKSRFDLPERWSSTRAFDWCAVRHQSFDLRRVTAILLQQRNFGPNVIYYVFWEECFERESRPAGAFLGDKIVFCTEKASRRGLLVAQECQKSVQEAQSSIQSCFIMFSGDSSLSAEWGGEP